MPEFVARNYLNTDTPEVVLHSLFLKYDGDNNGALNTPELQLLFVDDLGLSHTEFEAYALLLDEDGSGYVCFDEFVKWFKGEEKFKNIDDENRYAKLSAAVEMFKQYDVDNSQSIDRHEFKKLFQNIGCSSVVEVDRAFAEMDRDGNNVVSFLEFMKWLNWLPLDDNGGC